MAEAIEVRPKLSVIIPAYNEAANLAPLLSRIKEVLKASSDTWEIIVIDDGSADDTLCIIQKIIKEEPRIRLIHHDNNRGYGASVWSGISLSQSDRVVLIAGDLQYAPEEIPRLLEVNADVVAGWRQNRADPLYRRFYAWIWGIILRMIFGLHLHDIDCGFKRIDRRLLEGYVAHSTGAFIDAELLITLARRGARITEIPVSHFPRLVGNQTGAKPQVVFQAIIELIRFRILLKKQ